MAQPNVAREPSMEEILASIRRIIENNEPPEGEFHSEPVSASMADDSAIELTVDNHISAYDAPEIAAPEIVRHFEPAANTVTPISRSSGFEAERPKPMSLADVAARVRATAERGPIAPQRPAQQEPVEDPSSIESFAHPFGQSYAQPAAEIEPEADATRDVAVAAHAEPEISTQQTHQDRVTPEAEHSVEPDAERATGRAMSVAAPILSADAGEQVAKSFDELAQALHVSTRSLDDIAQDMLRPMLQDWLDNNLPTLVERLVREEIERVARGPRR